MAGVTWVTRQMSAIVGQSPWQNWPLAGCSASSVSIACKPAPNQCSQLGELEATERVLARYSKGTQIKKTTSARTPTTATKAAAPARRPSR
jgi:hypothetical protein